MPDIDELLAQLTVEEKEQLVNGDGMWTVGGVERLGIPRLKVTDGPNGARGDGLLGTGARALCIPCGSALGATWNVDLVERLGAALGDEARTKRAHVLLAPTINIHRSPIGGRNFECYAEDPELSGRLAAAFVRGVQSRRVACTPKHFVANDAEFERNTIDSVVDERALREIYLRPFELAVTEGGAWGLMAAYNRLNGTFCCEHPDLLGGVLVDEWGFDGVVVTDWFANRSTAASAEAGLHLEMPGPGRMWGEGRLAAAVDAGEVSAATLDEMVRRMLVLSDRTGAFDDPLIGDEQEIDRPEHRALAREAAAEAMVLLTNDGVLPLDPAGLGTLAVVGPNAVRAQTVGGGSANLRAFPAPGPLEAIIEAVGPDVTVVHAQGCDIDRTAPLVPGPVMVDVFDGLDLEGSPVATRSYDDGKVLVFGAVDGVADVTAWSARACCAYEVTVDGTHELSLVEAGWARVLVDGQVVIDGWRSGIDRGDDLFGMGSVELTARFDWAAGQVVDVVVEYSSRDTMILGGFQLACRRPATDDLVARAAEVAAGADAAVVVVGTNDDWETEGRDRDDMDLPGEQAELIRAVAAANPRTVVVVNAGSPVTTDWADDVGAVVMAWFGGQEMGPALADVLTGRTEPSGRLPLTFPRRLEHNPSYVNFPGENGQVRYGESVFVGYRHYDATDRDPAFCFGHGGSYTAFELSAPRPAAERVAVGSPVTVAVDVTNTGDRRGAQVVQAYVEPVAPRLARPPRELAAFAKVWLDPGASTRVELVLDERAFAYWDPGDPSFAELTIGSIVPTGGGAERRTDPGWYVDPGTYVIRTGTSSRDLPGTATVELH